MEVTTLRAKLAGKLIARFIFVTVGLLGAACTESSAPPDANPTMVTVPAGTGLIGCNEAVDSECEEDEKPGRDIETQAFEIDVTGVTVAQYRECVDASVCSAQLLDLPSSGTADEPELAWTCNWGKPDRDRHPINCISWEAAGEFCKWAKKRLPTATEWERAARGADGRRYPWAIEWGD